MTSNSSKWLLAIVIGFGFGALSAWTDSHANLGDVVRHGVIGVLPTLGALQMTLKKDLGIGQ